MIDTQEMYKKEICNPEVILSLRAKIMKINKINNRRRRFIETFTPLFRFFFFSHILTYPNKWKGSILENRASPVRERESTPDSRRAANVPLFRQPAVDWTVVFDVPRARRINNSTFKRPWRTSDEDRRGERTSAKFTSDVRIRTCVSRHARARSRATVCVRGIVWSLRMTRVNPRIIK